MQINSRLSVNSWNSINKIFSRRNLGFYCPHCEHCNNIKDENLEKYFSMKEAKNIIKTGFNYILENYDNDLSFLDFLLNFNSNSKENNNNSTGGSPRGSGIKENNNSHYPMHKNNVNNNMNLMHGEIENIKNNKKIPKFDIDILLMNYPKITNDRLVMQLVTRFLDALVNDKISIDHLVNPEIFNKLKDSLIAQGLAFQEIEGEMEFDKEIETLFEESTKEKIKKLFQCKNLINFFLK